MECIDWMQCYSNQSVTANEWLQRAAKQQQSTEGYGQDAAPLSWRQALIKFDIQAVRWEADHSVREGGFVSSLRFQQNTCGVFQHVAKHQYISIIISLLICFQAWSEVKILSTYI